MTDRHKIKPMSLRLDAAARRRIWAAANPELERARRRRWADASPERFLLMKARNRAKAANLPFDLEVSDIRIPQFCPLLGIPLERNRGAGPAASSPTLDRIVPEQGYVKGNVQVISHRANTLKRDASLEELAKLGAWATQQLWLREEADGRSA